MSRSGTSAEVRMRALKHLNHLLEMRRKYDLLKKEVSDQNNVLPPTSAPGAPALSLGLRHGKAMARNVGRIAFRKAKTNNG